MPKEKLTPPVVAILGPDGSGKSTVIAGVAERLSARGLEMHAIHWRPDVLKPRGGDGGPTPDPHAQPPRSYPASIAKLAFLFADWSLGYLGPFRRARRSGQLILCDRHYYDLLVDPLRYRFRGPFWLARLVLFILPKPDLLLLLDVDPEEIQRRKQEVPLEETRRQVEAYRQLVKCLKFAELVDAGGAPDEVADDVACAILASFRPPFV